MILVAPDKFKGSLSALEVAEAIGRGLAAAGIGARLLPLADGGDGSVAAALAAGFGARGGFAFDGRTAVVEVAGTCGPATLPGPAPMTASSRPFGDAVVAALAAGARRIVLCLGGSAGTDGGAGLLSALGVRFRDERGAELVPAGGTLHRIAEISGWPDLGGVELVVATDVTNPLLGPDGAAAVFGPQKGASPAQIAELEAGLTHFARLLDAHRPGPGPAEPGSGAAGGLGFACRRLGARHVSGAGFFLDLLGFDRALDGCAAVITGEGRLDGQTLGGKLPAAVAARAGARPVYAIVGRSELTAAQQHRLGLRRVLALTGPSELADLSGAGPAELSGSPDADPSRDPALSRRLVERAARALGDSFRGTTSRCFPC